MIRDFQILSKLGEGAYSVVYKVKRITDGVEYALKKIKLLDLKEKERENALNEVRLLASIRHPNIVSYKEAFFEKKINVLCIVMEYADDGDLFQKICEHKKKRVYIDEKKVWKIAVQMLLGIKALHELKVLHRDLKSANVFLFKDGTAKIGDMNVSKVAKKGLLFTQTGTPYYASPEVWNDQSYDSKSDIWSAGCVLYEMASLKPPFRADDMEGLYLRVTKGAYAKLPGHYSTGLSELIGHMLQVNPKSRLSAAELLSLPEVQEKVAAGLSLKESGEDGRSMLLQTIKFPSNLHHLTDKLPKPNYQPLQGNTRVGYKSEESVLRNRSAASKAHNRSQMEEKSLHDASRLPVLSAAKKRADEQERVRERLDKQHERVEQQIKKYDELLRRNLPLRHPYDAKKPLGLHLRSKHEPGSREPLPGKDLIAINGIRLDAVQRRAGNNKPHGIHGNHLHDSLLQERKPMLPALRPTASLPKKLNVILNKLPAI